MICSLLRTAHIVIAIFCQNVHKFPILLHIHICILVGIKIPWDTEHPKKHYKYTYICKRVLDICMLKFVFSNELEQLERLRSEDTLRRLMITHTIESYWIQVRRRQSQNYKFKEFAKISNVLILNKHYTWLTFWSCLIRCANMKWIRWVLLKIQDGH